MIKSTREYRDAYNLRQGKELSCSQKEPSHDIQNGFIAEINSYEGNASTERKSFSSVETKKPGPASPSSDAMKGTTVPPIIATYPITDNANNYLASEAAMSYDAGYLRIPRSLLEDPMFRDARTEYQHVFMVLLSRSAFAPYDINDHSVLVRVEVGEICFSIDQIARFCGRWITAKQVERAIHYFRKCHFLGQRMGHRRSILKITHSACYDMMFGSNGTRTGTRPGQDRDINKEVIQLERKNKKTSTSRTTPPVDDAEASRLCSLFVSDLKSRMPSQKVPENLSAWIKQFSEMLGKDGRKPNEIESAIKNIKGNFYAVNVESPAKFRKAFARFADSATAIDAKVKPNSMSLSELKSRLQGRYDCLENYGQFEVKTLQGYEAFKCAKSDLDFINNWLKEKSL